MWYRHWIKIERAIANSVCVQWTVYGNRLDHIDGSSLFRWICSGSTFNLANYVGPGIQLRCLQVVLMNC